MASDCLWKVQKRKKRKQKDTIKKRKTKEKILNEKEKKKREEMNEKLSQPYFQIF